MAEHVNRQAELRVRQVAPDAPIRVTFTLHNFSVVEYATRVARPFHLLRRFQPPGMVLTQASGIMQGGRGLHGRSVHGAEAYQAAAHDSLPLIRLQVCVGLPNALSLLPLRPPPSHQIALNSEGSALKAVGEIQRVDVKLSPALCPLPRHSSRCLHRRA